MKQSVNEGKPNKLSQGVLLLCCVLTIVMLFALLHNSGSQSEAANISGKVLDTYEKNLSNLLSADLGGNAPAVTQTYVLRDSDIVAPEPIAACFGETDDPAEMEGILAAARELLDGQETLFNTDIEIKPGSTIHYYLDDTIFAVAWKQVIDDGTYTMSEVKIAHASQFRRFLSEGKYNSGILHTTTEMSESVNAVMASSGDYYSYRRIGIVVNDGQVYRDRGHFLDTCYIDNEGDMIFSYRGDMTEKEVVQKFVDDNNIRFSICFGPVMILNGENCVPGSYNSGEITKCYPRAALCQMDKLHYVVAVANAEAPNYRMPTVSQFADRLLEMGIHTAYALDGGQTAAIVMDNQLINTVSYGSEREISDIFYFATAIPDGK